MDDQAQSMAIETRFAKNSYIAQSCLIGPNEPLPVILVVLSPAAKARERKDAEKSLRKTFSSANRDLNAFKTVSFLIVVQEDWTAENGLLMEDATLNRSAIEEKHRSLIEKTMAGNEKFVWQ